MRWGLSARGSTRRRAERFAALVEGAPGGDPAGDRASGDDGELLELVAALRSAPEVHARPEFVADLRAELMAEAETALTEAPGVTPADLARLQLPARHTRRERRIAALVGGVALVGASASVAVASQSALPGESLYPIKRVLESAHTGISLGDAARGSSLLGSATSRLGEAEELGRRGESGDRIAATLESFADQATQGADLLLADYDDSRSESSITRLRSFTADGLATLEALAPVVPYDARDEMLAAAALLTDLDARAREACPTCDTAPTVELPQALAQALAGMQVGLPSAPSSASDPAEATASDPSAEGGDRADQVLPRLPDVDPTQVGPGSIAEPAPSATVGSDEQTRPRPLRDLVDGLRGDRKPSAPPRVPVVSDVVDGVGELLDGLLDPLLDPLTGSLLGGGSDEADGAGR